MKKFNVYLYFPASELEIQVRADSLEEAVNKVDKNPHHLLADGVSWNDSTGKTVRVLGVLELGEIS